MTSALKLPVEMCERIAAYMSIARLMLEEKCPSSARLAELAQDLDVLLQAIHEHRLSHGWNPYPETEPEDDQAAKVALMSGETFPDVYYRGSWCTQKDSDVIAWKREDAESGMLQA